MHLPSLQPSVAHVRNNDLCLLETILENSVSWKPFQKTTTGHSSEISGSCTEPSLLYTSTIQLMYLRSRERFGKEAERVK